MTPVTVHHTKIMLSPPIATKGLQSTCRQPVFSRFPLVASDIRSTHCTPRAILRIPSSDSKTAARVEPAQARANPTYVFIIILQPRCCNAVTLPVALDRRSPMLPLKINTLFMRRGKGEGRGRDETRGKWGSSTRDNAGDETSFMRLRPPQPVIQGRC